MNRAQDFKFKFPVGKKPNWELDVEPTEEERGLELQSVCDSYVVVNSLKQSRATWLASTFPKFSSKARGGKAADAIPPPHTIRSLGKCDLHIGPHVFPSTSLYEVHYLPSAPSTSARPPAATPPNATWQSSAPYGAYMPYGQYVQQGQSHPIPVATAPPTHQRASTPLVSSVVADTPITPALIQQVNSAAGSDPILAKHLQLAASGKATADQLKTLGILIQSLAAGPSTVPPPQNAPSSAHYPTQAPEPRPTPVPQSLGPSFTSTPASSGQASGQATPPPYANYPYPGYHYGSASQYIQQPVLYPPRDFDIVIEFPEKPYDRWVFPRGAVICERKPADGTLEEIILTTALPFPKSDYLTSKPNPEPTQGNEQDPADDFKEVVTFKLTKAHQTVWESFFRWSGGSEKIQENRNALQKIKAPERVFLPHRLREGDLLTQLRNAATLPYAMKSIKPAYGDKPKPKRRAPRKNPTNTDESVPKRRKSAAKATNSSGPVRQIACITCGQTDVPLMLGGRFCRPCVDSGKAQNVINPSRIASSVSTPTGFPQPVPLTSDVSTPVAQSKTEDSNLVNAMYVAPTAAPVHPEVTNS